MYFEENIAKAQRTRGFNLFTKLTSLGHITRSYKNLEQIACVESSKSQTNISISTKLQVQNLEQTAKIQLHNLSFKIWPELQLKNLDQTLCSKSDQTSASKSAPSCSQHISQHQHQQQ